MRKVLFIFGTLTDADVEWLASAGERISLEPGTVLIEAGARIDYLYFVLDGQLVVKTRAGDTIAPLESGEILGEMSLVDPAPTAVSVEVLTDATVLRIADSLVREKLASDSGFAARFYRALCVFLAHRLRETTTRFGYGKASEEKNARDELNDDLLDTVHLAGARFERMLKRLAG